MNGTFTHVVCREGHTVYATFDSNGKPWVPPHCPACSEALAFEYPPDERREKAERFDRIAAAYWKIPAGNPTSREFFGAIGELYDTVNRVVRNG